MIVRNKGIGSLEAMEGDLATYQVDYELSLEKSRTEEPIIQSVIKGTVSSRQSPSQITPGLYRLVAEDNKILIVRVLGDGRIIGVSRK